MAYRNVTSANPFKKDIQDKIREAVGLPAGRGRVTMVAWDPKTQMARGNVIKPKGMGENPKGLTEIRYDIAALAESTDKIEAALSQPEIGEPTEAPPELASLLSADRLEDIDRDLDEIEESIEAMEGTIEQVAEITESDDDDVIPGDPFEEGDEVRVLPEGTSDGYRGIVKRVRGAQIDIVEFGTHGLRSTLASRVRHATRSTKAMDKFVGELHDVPRPNPKGRDIESNGDTESPGERVVKTHIKRLNSKKERKKNMAAKKNATSKKNGEAKAKGPRKAKMDFAGIKAEDFFQENKKGKSVFKPGHDARFAGILKRIAAGVATKDEIRIAKSKGMLNHPKVAESTHFQHLVKEAGL